MAEPAEVVLSPLAVTPWMVAVWTLLAVLGTVGSALCAGGEMGVYALNRVRLAVRARAPGRDSADILRAELEHTPRLLATLLVGYNLFSYAASVGMTNLLTANGYGERAIIAINVLVIAPVLFVLADTLPKELFRAEADRLMYALARPLRGFRLLLTWSLVLPATQAAARALGSLLGGAGEEAIGGARERIATLLKEGQRHGLMSETQVTLLDRALALRGARVGDEIVPWNRVAVIETTWNRRRVMPFIARHGFTRYPLVDAAGRVKGVVEHLDLCLHERAELASLAEPVLELSEDVPVREALVRMAEAGANLAVVMPIGPLRLRRTPLGIVTRKDLIEPLTGDFQAF